MKLKNHKLIPLIVKFNSLKSRKYINNDVRNIEQNVLKLRISNNLFLTATTNF